MLTQLLNLSTFEQAACGIMVLLFGVATAYTLFRKGGGQR